MCDFMPLFCVSVENVPFSRVPWYCIAFAPMLSCLWYRASCFLLQQYTGLVLAGGGLASLELLEVPVTDLHVAAVVVEALGEALSGAGAVVGAVVVVLLLGSGLDLLGSGLGSGGAATEEATEGMTDGRANGDTPTRLISVFVLSVVSLPRTLKSVPWGVEKTTTPSSAPARTQNNQRHESIQNGANRRQLTQLCWQSGQAYRDLATAAREEPGTAEAARPWWSQDEPAGERA